MGFLQLQEGGWGLSNHPLALEGKPNLVKAGKAETKRSSPQGLLMCEERPNLAGQGNRYSKEIKKILKSVKAKISAVLE